jgi:hypothetical protein
LIGRGRAGDVVKTLAFVIGLGIAGVGAMGIAAPAVLFWIAQRFVDSGALAFSVLAVVRIGFGAILISAAPTSRAPRALRILGWLIVALGATTALTALLGVDEASGAIAGWMQRGAGVARVTAAPILALGSFVAYACAPRARAAVRSG